MEKWLLDLFETAKSAADAAAAPGGGPADESRCIDSLSLLKSFPVNFKILSDTQAGKRLQILKRHPRKKIQEFAVGVIAAWKKVINEELNQKKKSLKSENKAVKEKPCGKLVIAKTAKVVKHKATKMVRPTKALLECEHGAAGAQVEGHILVAVSDELDACALRGGELMTWQQGRKELIRRALWTPPRRRPSFRWRNFQPRPSPLSNMST